MKLQKYNHLRDFTIFLLCMIALCLTLSIAAADEAMELLCFQQTGQVIYGKEEAMIYAQPDRKSEVLSQMQPGESCMVLGEKGKYYRVSYQQQLGYVDQSKLKMYSEKAVEPLEETLCKTVSLKEPVPSRLDTHLTLQGTITADKPLDALLFYLWDERQFEIEYTYMLSLKEPAQSISLDQYPRILPLKQLAGGRKTLVIEGVSENQLSVLYRSPAYVRGKSKELPNVNGFCNGIPKTLLDTDVKTDWSPKDNVPTLEITVDAEAKAAIMVLEWRVIPESCLVETWDENDQPLGRIELKNHFYVDCVDLEAGVRKIRISPQGEKVAMCSLRLYAEPYSRHVIQRWETVPEKLDLLVISTHQDDEFLFLGGTIPFYAAREDVSMAVLYMVNCGRLRYGEALDGLWSAGLRTHPLFLNLPDSDSHSINEAKSLWNRYHPLEQLVSVIRKYKPEVIVVQDLRGEYGNGEHKLTTALMVEAVQKAIVSTVDPESAELYGAWQVKKLYVHLYPENQIQMDWNQPLDETGIITPLFLAKEGFNRHRSQAALFTMESDGKRYDNSLFGLYYSAVGVDVQKNDFLENIK